MTSTITQDASPSAATKPVWSRMSRSEPQKRPIVSDVQRSAKLLARATADVVEGERRIARQIVLIEQLQEGGQPTAELERSLARLQASTDATRSRRAALLDGNAISAKV